MKQKLLFVLIGLLGVTLILAMTPISAYASFPTGKGMDEWIVATSKFLLENDNRLDPSRIEVSSNNGQISLRGTVMTDFEKAHAERIVAGVPGVKAVSNELRVVPPLDGDLALAKQVRSELLQHPLVKISALKVLAKEGSVQLYGFVQDSEQRLLIDQVIRSIPGIRSVQNQIVVLPAPGMGS